MRPEYRQDPVSGTWVIIAPDRAARPIEFRSPSLRETGLLCPFCAGNEEATPEARLQVSRSGSNEWQVRIVPNLYPALVEPNRGSNLDEVFKAGDAVSSDTSFCGSGIPAVGHHDVIIESPRHVSSMTELDDIEIECVIDAYRNRLSDLSRDPAVAFAMLFKNYGPAAGISLHHIHSQLVSMAWIPPVVARELSRTKTWCDRTSECLICDLIKQNTRRRVAENDEFVAFCPFASRFAYETWIVGKNHANRFESDSFSSSRLGAILQETLRRIEGAVPNVAYNWVLHSSPFDSGPYDHYHWHIEIIPRIATIAGFEWGSGCHINTVSPDVAAERLRNANL